MGIKLEFGKVPGEARSKTGGVLSPALFISLMDDNIKNAGLK